MQGTMNHTWGGSKADQYPKASMFGKERGKGGELKKDGVSQTLETTIWGRGMGREENWWRKAWAKFSKRQRKYIGSFLQEKGMKRKCVHLHKIQQKLLKKICFEQQTFMDSPKISWKLEKMT